jgi:outer membrane protein TolC
MRTLFSFLAVQFSFAPLFAASTIQLSPQDVIPLALKQSPLAQEIQLQADQSRLTQYEALKAFDFNFSATTGYQQSKFESTSTPLVEEDRTLSTIASLAKPFESGTTLTLQYAGTADSTKVSSGIPPDSAQDIAGVLLEQNLWRNFFGQADRAGVRAAEASVKSAEISRLVSLQNLALDSLSAYWNAYVSQQTYQAAVKSRDRYQKLTESIQKKTRYGYANPAELAQAQAELENRVQTAKTAAANYLLFVDQLRTRLGLPKESEIQFVVPKTVPTPPVIKSIQIENARPIQVAHLAVTAADETLTKTKSQSDPDVSLLAQYYVQGLDPSASEAQNEMAKGVHPKYFIGLRFQQTFGSGYQDENIRNKKLAKDLAIAQLERKKLEFQDQEEDIKRRLESTYSIFQSSENQRLLREKASQELTKSYTQGRTDLSILIDAINKYFDSETLVSRSLADYQMALAQWQALQDQLIPGT